MRWQQITHRGWAVAIPVLAAAAALALYWFPPTEVSWYPGCTFYRVTGLHCPGCGATRALAALLHGDLPQAAAYNLLFVLVLPFLGVCGVLAWWEAITGRRTLSWRVPTWLIWVVVGLLVAFGVLRNVPVYPFTLLAPHVL